MDGYLTRRLVTTPLVLLGVSFILFLIAMPASRMRGVLLGYNYECGMVDPYNCERTVERYGLNDPWYERYGDWLWSALQGNFGEPFAPPSAQGRDYPLLLAAAMTAWGLYVLVALARDIRKPRLRINARAGEHASARRLGLLTISVH